MESIDEIAGAPFDLTFAQPALFVCPRSRCLAPQDMPLDEAHKAVLEEFAFKLPALFVEAGIGAPDGTDINLPMTSLEPFASTLGSSSHQMSGRYARLALP
jgi:hypothetical protein